MHPIEIGIMIVFGPALLILYTSIIESMIECVRNIKKKKNVNSEKEYFVGYLLSFLLLVVVTLLMIKGVVGV